MRIETARGPVSLIDRRAAVTLVLLHPFPLSAEAWRADADALAKRVRVVAPSARGFGGTPVGDGDPSIDAMADDVAAVLDGLEIPEPVVVGGLSMGGYVALSFARRHAQRLRALLLADTRAEPDSEEARANRDRAIARVEQGDLAGFVDDLVTKLLSPRTSAERPEIVEKVRALALSAPPRAVALALRALRDRPDARPGLGAIEVPTLVVVGEDDVLTPPSAAKAMADAIPHAELRVINGAGHLSNLEQPIAFRDAVGELISRL
jgi:pimeloyl-ACP methyl ester carboxylesterase